MLSAIEFKKRAALFVYGGITTPEDFAHANKIVGSSEELDRLLYVLHDCSKVNSFNYSEAQLIEMAAFDLGMRVSNKGIKAAFIGDNQSLADALTAYELLTKCPVKQFHSVDEASDWLKD